MMSAIGLPREARLRRPGDFAALRNVSGRPSGRCFLMRYRRNELGLARLGLAISKRVSKRAVDRNRLKRLIRESFRRVRCDLPAIDVMVMARESAVTQPSSVLLQELDALWRRIIEAEHKSATTLMQTSSAGTIAR